MRKGIRITVISLLLLAGIGMITWYFIMRRQVPEHARCIPANAIAVLTLNLRELALDHASGGHLFPEMAEKKLPKELERFSKAIEKNDGLGLSKTADVLGFFYREGDAAFFGVSASIKDSAKFGKLVREQLAEEFSLRKCLFKPTVFQFDTSSAVISWNKDIALFMFPIGDQSASETADQCYKLLFQAKEKSVLVNENFREHELSSFDAGIWMQPQEFLAFSGGSDLQRIIFNNIKCISLAMDFQDGELIMRRIITTEKNSPNPFNAPILLTCDPKQVLGFYHGIIDLQNDSMVNYYADAPPFNMLPLNDERSALLAKTLNGNFTLLIHDTFSFDMNYITYEYDADFNPVPQQGTKRVNERGGSASFGVKDPATARKLLTEWMKEDSIPLTGNTWLLNNSQAPHYMMLTDSVLTVASWKQVDGKPRSIPVAWEGLDAFLPIGNVIIPDMFGSLSFFFPQIDGGEILLKENVGDLLISQPLVVGNKSSSQIRLTMHNKKVNALIQFEELFRKISKE